MASHRFFLLPGDGHWPEDWGYEQLKTRLQVRLRHEDAVELPMDLYDYIADTLPWIRSTNPANPRSWPGHGLNAHGPTLIDRHGADAFRHVFGSWATLFAGGPRTIRLTGNTTYIREGEILRPTGEFAKYEFNRDTLVTTMRTLEQYGLEAEDGEAFTVHLGI